MARKTASLPSSWGAKARAAAGALKNSTAQHLSPEQFGRHAAPASYGSVRKNATGGNGYQGRHQAGNGRHAGGYDSGRDAEGVARNGSSAYGKHARTP